MSSGTCTIWMENENKVLGGYFYLLSNDGSHYVFSEYFINLREVRMLKLKRLKEVGL